MSVKIRLSVDESAMAAIKRDLGELFTGLASAPAAFVDRAFEVLGDAKKLVRFDSDHAAAVRTGELVLRAQPTDAFRDLLAAVRAGNFDLGVFVKFGHSATSTVDGSPAVVGEPAGGGESVRPPAAEGR